MMPEVGIVIPEARHVIPTLGEGSPSRGELGSRKEEEWPRNKPVDWADATERRTWASELRDHIWDLFVVGLERSKPGRKHLWTQEEVRQSLFANKRVIDEMLGLAGAPLEDLATMWIPPPLPPSNEPPEIVWCERSPFRELPVAGWLPVELARWLGYVEGQIDYLAGLVLGAYPEESQGHMRGRWAVIRLRLLFAKLRVALLMRPMRR